MHCTALSGDQSDSHFSFRWYCNSAVHCPVAVYERDISPSLVCTTHMVVYGVAKG
jgi:hypothetical protein